MSNPILRGEMWKLTFAPQWSEAAIANVVYADGVLYATYLTNMPGIFENASMPDPEITIDPRWGYGNASVRNWYNVYLGKTTLSGGISDITVLNGIPLRFPIGQCKTVPAGVGTAATTLSGAHTAGAISITCAAASYSANDVICVDDGGSLSEARYVVSGSNPYVLNYPLSYDHATGVAIKKYGTVGSPPTYYTHTITDGLSLSPIQLAVDNTDTDGTVALMRRYIGCKVGRASLAASEGGTLRMAWDEILGRTMAFKDASASATVPFYSANVATVTPSFPTTDPYYFSQGALTFAGQSWCRVRDFTLDVSNSVEPKYYLCSTSVANRVPYELLEGRKEWAIKTTVDITDADFYLDLLRMGTYSSAFSGFDISLVFTRGSNDTITITAPGTTAAEGGDSQGCFIRRAPHNIEEAPIISVPLEIVTRSVKITVVDSIMVYP